MAVGTRRRIYAFLPALVFEALSEYADDNAVRLASAASEVMTHTIMNHEPYRTYYERALRRRHGAGDEDGGRGRS